MDWLPPAGPPCLSSASPVLRNAWPRATLLNQIRSPICTAKSGGARGAALMASQLVRYRCWPLASENGHSAGMVDSARIARNRSSATAA